MGLFLSSTMYLSGMLRFFSCSIFSSLILSTFTFWDSQFSWNFLFSISFTFFACWQPSSLFAICFFSSLACFNSSCFLSFSSFSSVSLSYLCFLTAASNSAFSAFATSSSLLSFSSCCSSLAWASSSAFLALISASILSFSRAALSLASTALLALSASSSACLSDAFSWSYLSFWISFSFCSLMRLHIKRNTSAQLPFQLACQLFPWYRLLFSLPPQVPWPFSAQWWG